MTWSNVLQVAQATAEKEKTPMKHTCMDILWYITTTAEQLPASAHLLLCYYYLQSICVLCSTCVGTLDEDVNLGCVLSVCEWFCSQGHCPKPILSLHK